MDQFNVQEAKTQLSRLLARVEAGEEVIIARYGKPVARLVPVGVPPRDRERGTWKGQLRVGEDFDEEMPEEWLAPLEPSRP